MLFRSSETKTFDRSVPADSPAMLPVSRVLMVAEGHHLQTSGHRLIFCSCATGNRLAPHFHKVNDIDERDKQIADGDRGRCGLLPQGSPQDRRP
jgi:hypothetical protein